MNSWLKNVDGDEFDDSKLSHALDYFEKAYEVLPEWGKPEHRLIWESEISGKLARFYTPYQFMLPVLQMTFVELLAASEAGLKDELSIEFENSFDSYEELARRLPKIYSNCQKCSHHGEGLFCRNPRPDKVQELPLRALAYLSWEESSRVSLIRRVYPSYHDFLSVSQVPGGWGASGLMLDEYEAHNKYLFGRLQGGDLTADIKWTIFPETLESKVRPQSSPEDSLESYYLRYTLPYILEGAKAGYNQILVAPVIEGNILKGFLLLFLRKIDFSGQDENKFFSGLGDFFKKLGERLAKVISLHEKKLGHSEVELFNQYDLLRDAKEAPTGNWSEDLLGISFPDGNTAKVDSLKGEVLRRLSTPDFFGVKGNGSEVIVLRRPGLSQKDFQRELIRILSEATFDRGSQVTLNNFLKNRSRRLRFTVQGHREALDEPDGGEAEET